VLALNQPEKVENRANICYFALSRKMKPAMRRAIFTSRANTPLLLFRAAHWAIARKAPCRRVAKLGGGSVLQQKFGSTAELRAGVNGGRALR
jgi:outer membrane PBP1 activator LpoA protein